MNVKNDRVGVDSIVVPAKLFETTQHHVVKAKIEHLIEARLNSMGIAITRLNDRQALRRAASHRDFGESISLFDQFSKGFDIHSSPGWLESIDK